MIAFAPAKINLFLHLTGKRDDGYHDLQSLVCFANVGDEIEITSDKVFEIDGPFARNIDTSDNSLLDALNWLEGKSGKPVGAGFKLIKNLPVAAGIGGGSSDAAAVLRALNTDEDLIEKSLDLGADVPVCLYNEPAFVEGLGEKIMPASLPYDIPAVLVNPLIPCPTASVFKAFDQDFSASVTLPEFKDYADMISFLKGQHNDLQEAAMRAVPDIQDVIYTLEQTSSDLVRMSGSGATCFALYKSVDQAEEAMKTVKEHNPHWWVHSCLLNPS